MPLTAVTPNQMALLRRMAYDGIVIVGRLGEDPLCPNQRIYRTSEGDPLNERLKYSYRTANSLEAHGLIKVISTSGEDPPLLKYLTITERGRVMAERGRVERSHVGISSRAVDDR